MVSRMQSPECHNVDRETSMLLLNMVQSAMTNRSIAKVIARDSMSNKCHTFKSQFPKQTCGQFTQMEILFYTNRSV